ncbi:hypothetical protein [Peijinzhouia sedimentorum]
MKHCIVIGATLKPLNDARHFHKIALSLDQTSKYDLNIIGRDTKNIQPANNITFHPIIGLEVSNFTRILAPLKYLRKTWQIKPDLQIICSWELLPAAGIFKLLKGGKLVYDIQENYINNIRYLGKESWIVKKLKILIINYFQKITWSSIDSFLLAEQSYESEFKLKNRNYKILENKSLQILKESTHSNKLNFIFSGTIGEAQGIWDVIQWAEKAHQIDQSIQLTIVGHCPSLATYKALLEKAGGKKFISLQIETEPVAYNSILNNITKADFGVIAYPPNRANQDKFPSKLYEYLATQLPVFLLHSNASWEAIIDQYEGGISSRTYPSIANQIQAFKSRKFYQISADYSELLWESNEAKLLDSIAKLLDK